jgi:membrane-associated phospholipid phosphatase
MLFRAARARPARPILRLGVAMALALLGESPRAHAAEPCAAVAPWDHLGTSARNFAQPIPLTLTGLAVAAPFALAPTGGDQRLRIVAQRDLGGRPNLEPVTVATPYVLAGTLLLTYGVGSALGACRVQRVLSPVLQAGTFTFTAVALLKLGVGRRWPNGGADPRAPDRLEHPEGAHDFTPFRRGFAAWPSGHTALMFSAAAAFRASNPELGAVAFAGYPLALGVAAGMWLGDHHYGSDIVSGALLGEAIGDSAGASFARVFGVPGAFTLVPQVARAGESGFSIQWAGAW